MIARKKIFDSLLYNKETGIFVWKNTKRSDLIGKEAGCINSDGYLHINIDGKKYKLHRLAWLYMYGCLPSGSIDHINGDRIDNRIKNLRDVTKRENSQNRKEHRDGKSVGVFFIKESGKWRASSYINGKHTFLGYYESEEKASEIYWKAINGKYVHNSLRKDREQKGIPSGVIYRKSKGTWEVVVKRKYYGSFHDIEQAKKRLSEVYCQLCFKAV